MATSPIYSWPEPDNTDLVKNGALAIRTLGNAIDTTMGTMVAKTVVDAKGDLIAGTAADTVNRLAVGNNGETLVADSSTSTGLRYQGNYAAGKNKIINGDFGIWQRGTSFAPPALDSFVCDRFRTYMEGSGTTRAVTRQTFTPGTAPVAGYEGQYFLRYAQTVGPSAGIGNNLLMQNIEDVRTFANQTVTFSFWAKAAATTVLPQVYAYQYFGTGGSPSGNVQTVFASNVSVGTSWTRYSYTAVIPSISGKTIGTNNDGYISFRTQHPLGSGDTFTIDYWGWQAEIGNTATAFQTATGTIQGESAACERYYQRFTNNQGNSLYGSGFASSSTAGFAMIKLNQSMRTVPSFSASGNFIADDGNSNLTVTTFAQQANGSSVQSLKLTYAGTGMTAFRPNTIQSNGGFFEFSAEL